MSQPTSVSRTVPWPLRGFILVGGWKPLGWIAMASVLVVVLHAFVLPEGAPRSGPSYDRRADGLVTRVEKTNLEIMNEPVMMVVATFTDDRHVGHEVRSYEATTTPPDVDSKVGVRYQSADPGRAVIDGMRTDKYPWWLSPLVMAIIMVSSAAPIAFDIRRRWRALRLLRHGEHAIGTIVEVNRMPRVSRAAIEVTTRDQRVIRIEASSPKPSFFAVGHSEAVVFDPAFPKDATLLRQLPGKPVIENDGRVHVG